MLTIFDTDDRVEREKLIFGLLRRRVDGVLVVLTPDPNDYSHILDAQAPGTKVVCLDREPIGIEIDAVVADNVAGAAICVRHLTSLGHRRIALIIGRQDFFTARERLKRVSACPPASGSSL